MRASASANLKGEMIAGTAMHYRLFGKLLSCTDQGDI